MHQVIVVGAGIAGLAAAAELAKLGKRVLVLEADLRIGGRIFTEEITLPGEKRYKFEHGASWIHGSCAEHPITALAAEAGLNTVTTIEQSLRVVSSSDGRDVTKKVFQSEQGYYKLLKGMKSLQGKDKSVRQYIEQQDLKLLQDPYFMRLILIDFQFWTSGTIESASAKVGYTEDKFKGTQEMVEDYSRLCSHLVAKHNLDVRLGSRVVLVAACEKGSLLRTDSGQQFRAEQVVIATPIKALQYKAIGFDPPLPSKKQTAFNMLEMGSVCKVLIIGKTKLDAGKYHFVQVIPERPEERGLCTLFLNIQAVSPANLLITQGLGPNAEQVENMEQRLLKALVAKRLTAALNRQVDVDEFDLHRTGWNTNKLIGGAYTFARVGSTFGDWVEVVRPVQEQQWFFCGEYATFRFRGAVHGAYLSGVQAALDVCKRGQNWEYIDQKWWNSS